ncbi:hypothetical protein ACVXHB_15910 [Escherichia coli]
MNCAFPAPQEPGRFKALRVLVKPGVVLERLNVSVQKLENAIETLWRDLA